MANYNYCTPPLQVTYKPRSHSEIGTDIDAKVLPLLNLTALAKPQPVGADGNNIRLIINFLGCIQFKLIERNNTDLYITNAGIKLISKGPLQS